MNEVWTETKFQWNDWRNFSPLWACVLIVPLIGLHFCWLKLTGQPLYD